MKQWAIPQDGQNGRVVPTSQLLIYPPCLDGSGAGVFPTVLGQAITECSDAGLAYVVYIVTINNQDAFDRAFRLTVGGHVDSPQFPMGVGGMHCWIPGNGTHFDSGSGGNLMSLPPSALPTNTFDATVPANGTVQFWCEILDMAGVAARVNFDVFTVQPCKGAAGGSCVVYP